VADVNGDGWMDVAVSHLGTGSTFSQPIAWVYLNNGGTLSSAPDWSADILGNAFGCGFGDMNGDGRPDLAVGTGWPYSPQHHYRNYVYLNVDGALEPRASWVSDDQHDYQGVLWVDADDDGWLDLLGIPLGGQTRLYRNLGGVLETTASWSTIDSANQDGIMLTAGDVTGDGVLDLFATDNTQLGGTGRFKQYTGVDGGMFETTYSWSYYEGYGSAVALADVNGDGLLDLATGAWWDQVRLFHNTGTGLAAAPAWSSNTARVTEKIVFGDVDPPCGVETVFTESLAPDGDRRLFYLPHQQFQEIIGVVLDGAPLDPHQYTYDREHGWISLSVSPMVALDVTYTYARSLDMAVSNWDSDVGNFLFYSSIVDDCNDNGVADGCDVFDGTSDDVNANGVPDECESPCAADTNNDGVVDVDDLTAVILGWGTCPGCLADVDGDGDVDVDDLTAVILAWGDCP
jgi:hypothetical protein